MSARFASARLQRTLPNDMNYRGKIIRIERPFGEDSSKEWEFFLALGEADEDGLLECIGVKRGRGEGNRAIIPLKENELMTGEKLPGMALYLEKKFFILPRNIQKIWAGVNQECMEGVLRNMVLLAAEKYSSAEHERGEAFTPGDRISYAERFFDKEEVTFAVEAALDFWLTSGQYVEEFERSFAQFLGVPHCSLTNSGSSANLLAFMALTSPKLGDRRIRQGDEVITAAATFPTTVTPILQYGAVPVFVDISLPGYNLDCNQLEAALSPRSKAVMVAHTMGNPFDLAAVKSFCDRHSLWLIEDNCDALGSKYFYQGKWHFTGSLGHIGTCSFYPPHHITMGEGGAVCTRDPLLRRLVESFRDWGRDCWCFTGHDNTCQTRFLHQFGQLPFGYDHKYVYSHFGYNLKATEMQAAIGCAQLKKLEFFIRTRRFNWKYLYDQLQGLEDRLIFPEATEGSEPSWFGFLLTVRDRNLFSRDEIVRHLEAHNIQTRMLFCGNIIRQPCFDEIRDLSGRYRVIGNLRNTDRVTNDTFWIGVHPGLNQRQMDYMAATIRSYFSTKGLIGKQA